jgi:lipopolysaccharide transport system ATP-binding protein
MTDTIIEVENLGKRYVLDHQQEREKYTALRDVITQGVKSVLGGFGGKKTETKEEFWALKDVSFEVKRGEVVGIIGRNGAGKSTLLKILSRITEPTTGRVRLKGRVASLLEVGTGFHPELTGRENIYLNGAVLGMMREEIDRKFDEIVAFAEVEKFLDTPVKRYSSGMYVRLAFAVAAHLEPEILVVDEVLAVGDAAFQKKCLGKMGDVASKEGRTVLFVSHDMAAVQSLCQEVVLLKSGQIKVWGASNNIVAQYLNDGIDVSSAKIDLVHHRGRSNSQEPAIKRIWIINEQGMTTNSIFMGESFSIAVEITCSRPIINPSFGFGIEDEQGRRIFSLNNYMIPRTDNTFKSIQSGIVRLKIPHNFLLSGSYFVSVSLVEQKTVWVDFVEQAISINIVDFDVYSSGSIPQKGHGCVFVDGEITFQSFDCYSLSYN